MNIKTIISIVACIVVLFNCSKNDVQKGNVSLSLGDYEMAEEFFSSALADNPADFEARLGMGKALLQRAYSNFKDDDAFKRAVVNLQAAHTIESNENINYLLSEVWYNRSQQLLTAYDTVAATEALKSSLDYHPENTDALNTIGILYFMSGETTRSKRVFERALALDSDNTVLLFNAGLVFYHMDRIKTAHSLWLEALQRNSDDEEIVYWFALAESRLRKLESETITNEDELD
ncbi:hypothetical protein QA601_17985 [Chitinispirillales bacterium ANBcel5]|uniref:tetratricopeptide repeat protein n=1 Tax=Cellulosispirillum alkaliphilum TaxID=3039283 RepID=UPI002A544576|nr:hypothetical protein [Chitinispirillales bacterium ANBcel5]